MPDLYVICHSRDLVISSNNPAILHQVIAALVIEFVTLSPAERVEVLRP